jgi:hypothetical protein
MLLTSLIHFHTTEIYYYYYVKLILVHFNYVHVNVAGSLRMIYSTKTGGLEERLRKRSI